MKAKDPAKGNTPVLFYTRNMNFILMCLTISRAKVNSESSEVGNLSSQWYIKLPPENLQSCMKQDFKLISRH